MGEKTQRLDFHDTVPLSQSLEEIDSHFNLTQQEDATESQAEVHDIY